MRKNYILWSMLILMVSASTGRAQTYSLNDLSAAEFEAGGNAQWSFEKYDVATGDYSVFTLYGDSGRVNYFDRYNPERYSSYPIMSNPAVATDPYPIKRNSWFNDKNEYLYVARDYDDATACVDLEYWTSIPATLRGYEVYSAPAAVGGTFRNAAIIFTVPAEGYYKVDMSVLREDNIREEAMNVIQRFRYGGKSNVSDICRINQGFSYGAGGDGASNPDITLPTAPENQAVGTVRYAAQTVTPSFFYIYAKAGDKISFETDARNVFMNNNVRDVWARTKWTNLALTVTTEATAKADLAKFCDPYSGGEETFAQLDALLEQAAELISNHNSNRYPQSALNALEAVYTAIDNAYDNIQPLEAASFVEQTQKAIDNYLASAFGLKVRYTFDNVTDTTVPDVSGSGNNGALLNNASIVKLGKYQVLDLGTENGYLDMGAKIGNTISNMDNYTVSVYYRVDVENALSGNGHMLWAFSTATAASASAGQYIYYRLREQTLAITPGGWNNEKNITVSAAPSKGSWQHLVFKQEGTNSELYVNGRLVASGTAEVEPKTSLPLPAATFTSPTPYNWIGRPPFSGDNYMKNTMVYDFRLYNQALPVDSITKWAAIVPDLDNETLYGETGDFTELNALISQYSNAVSQWAVGDGIGQYPQGAIDEFTDAVAAAQTLINENKASQYLIDIQVTALKAAFGKLEAAIGYVILHPEAAGETDYPFESGLYYIEVGDYYLTMPEEGVVNTFTELRRYIDNEEKLHNNQVWNIQYNPVYSDLTLETPRALYSFVSGKTVWEEDGAWHLDEVGRMKEGNTGVTQSETGSNWDWREHRIYFNGTAYSLVNNHTNNAIVFAGETENELPQSLAAKKFNFKFRTIDDVVADPKLPNAIQNPTVGNNAKIYVSNGEIVVSNIETGSLITVYNISGRLVKTVKASTYVNRLPLASGLYIVKIAGQTPVTAKVIIR